MVKVSISLPNNTQITFESDEAEVLREIVSMALRDLPRDLMQAPTAGDGQPANESPADESAEKSTSVAGAALSAAAAPEPEPGPTPAPEPAPDDDSSVAEPAAAPAPVAAQELSPPVSGDGNGQATAEMPAEFLSEEGQRNFAAFCQETNPLGDMRRVVVAAEGASRHFGADGVNADDLGWLFDMARWRRPGDFTQTLRNAARSKFGWLERIPGRSGRYAATPLGLSKTLPN